MDYAKTKLCEACKKPFGCGAEARSCWCFDAPLSPDVLRVIQEKFNDCLCPSCLMEFVRSQ